MTSFLSICKSLGITEIDFLADCITPVAQGTRVHACTTKPSVTEEIFHVNNQRVVAKRKDSINFKQKVDWI